MDKKIDHECGQSMSPLKKPDDESCEMRDDAAAEESNLKPLKKAHYVWQIKGNYHLKNPSCDSETKDSSFSGASSSVTQEVMNCKSDPSSEPTNEAEHTPPFCEHHPSASQPGADSSLTNSNEEYPPLPPLRIGATTVSCVVCDTFNENIRRASLNIDGERSRTPPLPTSHPDWNVRKWQTRQIAKAFMDNTINCVLEEMGFTPVPESAPDSDPDDVLGSINFPRVDDDSVEEEEEDESVENEGILSAIQRHGLQRHTLQSLPEVAHRYSYSSSSPTRCSPSPPKLWGPSQQLIYRPMYHEDEVISSPESVSVGSDFGVTTEGQALSPTDIEADEAESSSDSNSDEDNSQYNYIPPSSCRCAHLSLSKSRNSGASTVNSNGLFVSSDNSNEELRSELKKPDKGSKLVSTVSHHECSSKLSEQEDQISKKRQGKDKVSSSVCKRRCVESIDEDSKCSSSTSSQSSQSSKLRTSPDLDGDVMTIASHTSGRNSPTFGHFEFMDAAVAAAIQKKGLSALACQDL